MPFANASYQLDSTTQSKSNVDTSKIDLIEANDDVSLILPEKPYKPTSIELKADSAYIPNTSPPPIREIQKTNHTATEQVISFEATVKKNNVNTWQTLVLIFAVLLIALTKAYNSRRFQQILQSFGNIQIVNQILREEKPLYNRVNLLLSSAHLLLLSLFIIQLNSVFNISPVVLDFSLFLTIIISLIIIYGVKIIGNKILAFILNIHTINNEYTLNLYLFNNIVGITLIPILLLLYYTSINNLTVVYYIAFPALSILFFHRITRLFFTARTFRFSYVYIFLYFCTLEILPLVVILKFFILD